MSSFKQLTAYPPIPISELKLGCMMHLNNLIICGSREGQLLEIDIQKMVLGRQLDSELGSVECLLKFKDNEFLASGNKDIKLFIIKDSQFKCIKTFQSKSELNSHNDSVIGLGISENWLYSASEDSKVIKWNLEADESMILYQHEAPIICFDVEKHNGSIVSCCADPKMKIFKRDSSTPEEINLDAKVWAVKFLKNDQGIICGDHEGNIFIVKDNRKGQIISIHESRIKTLSISEDSRYIVSGSFDQTIVVLDTQLKKKFEGNQHKDWIRAAIFTSNHEIVSTGDDQQVIFWQLPENQPKNLWARCCCCQLL